MITRIAGKIIGVYDDGVEIQTPCGLVYFVAVSPASQASFSEGDDVELFTYHYIQNEPSKAVEFLIGFLTKVELEFFELFITVGGIGPKAAVKSFSMPVWEIARAICEGDIKTLTSMPGIGPQKARQIIARLQDKAAKFALFKGEYTERPKQEQDIFEEVFEVLLQLQYKKSEAKELIKKVISSGRQFNSVEEVLEEIYKGGIAR